MRMLLSLAAVVVLLVGGCQSKPSADGIGRDQWNRDRFGSAPAAVVDGFTRDYADRTVTKVTAYDRAPGRTVYGVSYIDGTRVKFATYAETGARISPPVPPTMRNY